MAESKRRFRRVMQGVAGGILSILVLLVMIRYLLIPSYLRSLEVWLDSYEPDLAALEETKASADDGPIQELVTATREGGAWNEAEWNRTYHGIWKWIADKLGTDPGAAERQERIERVFLVLEKRAFAGIDVRAKAMRGNSQAAQP